MQEINNKTGALLTLWYSFVICCKLFFRVLAVAVVLTVIAGVALFLILSLNSLSAFVPYYIIRVFNFISVTFSALFIISYFSSYIILSVVERETSISFYDSLINALNITPRATVSMLGYIISSLGIVLFLGLGTAICGFILPMFALVAALISVIIFIALSNIYFLAFFISVAENANFVNSITTASEYLRGNWLRIFWKHLFYVISMMIIIPLLAWFISMIIAGIVMLLSLPLYIIYYTLVYESVVQKTVFYEANLGEKVVFGVFFAAGISIFIGYFFIPSEVKSLFEKPELARSVSGISKSF